MKGVYKYSLGGMPHSPITTQASSSGVNVNAMVGNKTQIMKSTAQPLSKNRVNSQVNKSTTNNHSNPMTKSKKNFAAPVSRIDLATTIA